MLGGLRKLMSRRRVEIPDELWAEELGRLPWLRNWNGAELARLREHCARFLAEKSITGAAGLVPDARMQLHIAAQACVPVSRLGLHWYRGWSGIVVYPASFLVRRHVHEASGVVSEFDAELTGEAWDGGPVILSWQDAAGEQPPPGHGAYNVVIHEFAHKIDQLDGDADGVPPFDPRLHAGLDRGHWQETLDDAYERFCEELDLVDAELPRDVDPESEDAQRYYAHLPLDPYAGEDPGEFFAVSSESFFLDAARLALVFPQWFECLERFYRPDSLPG